MSSHVFYLLTLATTLTFTSIQDQDKGRPSPPNIVLFLADDLGYGDLGCFGNGSLRTPHIDRLAREGTKLTHSLTAASLCTPSRAAFMTGRYPIRSGMASPHFARASFLTACNTGLPASELTLAEVVKQAGYRTALIGKWHLGWSVDRSDPNHLHPLNQGFDYFYGIPLTLLKDFDPRESKVWQGVMPNMGTILLVTCGCTAIATFLLLRMLRPGCVGSTVALGVMLTVFVVCGSWYLVSDNLALLNSYFYRNYELVEQPIQLPRITRKLVQEGVQFLEERKKDNLPFLLMMSWLHVHTPLSTSSQFRGQSKHGPFGDAVEELDWGVGEVTAALERLGLGENTLVYFTSDNGGHLEERDFAGRRTGGHNGVLKGGKSHGAPDGAIRVPTILKWAGRVPAGHVIDEPISLMDVLPTLARAVHVTLPANQVLDGKDLLPLLTGEVEVSDHEFLFHYCQMDVHAVRYRPRIGNSMWKLVLYEPAYLPGTQQCHFACTCLQALPLDPPPIFDLTSDPGEQRPLLEKDLPEYRALVAVMLKALEEHKRSIEPVENRFSVFNMWWRPWSQPVCRFPQFYCTDDKFKGMFEDDDNDVQ